MIDLYQRIVFIVLIWTIASTAKTTCPIGFQFAEYKSGNRGLCYRIKGPERFSDIYKNCTGNLYTVERYNNLKIPEHEYALWTQYKNAYPGGRFVDWSYTETTGRLLREKVQQNESLLNQDLCVVIDSVTSFTAVSCEAMHHRYCLVYPYEDEKALKSQPCADFDNGYRFYSPMPTCLAEVPAVGEAAVRATWKQAKNICEKRGGYLLNFGWMYSNFRSFSHSAYPLGFAFNSELTELKLHLNNGTILIPRSEWKFSELPQTNKTRLSAVGNNMWFSVNSSFVFYAVICEVSVPVKDVVLNLTIDSDDRLILNVSEPVPRRYLKCFTDSVKYYPTPVDLDHDEENTYVVQEKKNGYYWCIHTDSKSYTISQSNKVLHIPKKNSLDHVYAVKLHLQSYTDPEKIYKALEKLEEYIYLSTKYFNVHGNDAATEDQLRSFELTTPSVGVREVLSNARLKKWFVGGRALLVHFELDSSMRPVRPGTWKGLELVFMKPVYYCPDESLESGEAKHLGESISNTRCQTRKCVGDYNEGVQWLLTTTSDCEMRLPVTLSNALKVKEVTQLMPTVANLLPDHTFGVLDTESTTPALGYTQTTTETQTATNDPVLRDVRDSSEEITETTRRPTRPPPPPTDPVITVTTPTDVITAVPTMPPTTMPRPSPEDQLLQVMENLESIINNASLAVSLETISSSFDQVDGLLSEDDDLDIPGELLHLLDNIGPRLNLEGSDAATVRENIALVVAKGDESLPMRGLRLATRDTDAFTDHAFEVIRDEINSSLLQPELSDVVVKIPGSVSVSNRRVSFVVFRTDRAFRNPGSEYSVNSRVVSIKIGNLTRFQDEEFIDIYLNPIVELPGSKQKRVCAYWEFLEDGTGYWSQDGCVLMRSEDEGMLDYCRCTHLTHFAEILIPRTSFSDAHENALELISVIGCCVSILGLVLVAITAILFRSWRRDFTNKIWLQLCLAIFITSVCFLVIVFADFLEYNIACMLVGVLLHYAVLASFCWMLVAAIISYRKLVIVFSRDASHKLLKASAFSWGAPCAVVGVLLSVAPHSYAGQFDGDVRSGAFCYPSGLSLWLTVYAPIAVMLLVNWTLFLLIVRSVFASRRIQRHGDSNEALRCASVSCLLVFLFGLPWVFGLFLNNIVTVYLFNLTATFQGFVLFLFFVPGNKKTRDLWLNKLKIKQTRKVPVTSSTYTNRSTGGNPGSRVGNTSVPAQSKETKPRSMSSSDDSRFS